MTDDQVSALSDAQRIKTELRKHDRVRIECANEEEANDISKYLTPTERSRVQFTWRAWS
jgi:hypothetical protein